MESQNPYRINPIQESYASGPRPLPHSPSIPSYAPHHSSSSRPTPSYNHSSAFNETSLVHALLNSSPLEIPPLTSPVIRLPDQPSSLADRVFGRQLEQGYESLFENSLAARERTRLHHLHLQEIDEWRNKLMNQLSLLRRPYCILPPQLAAQAEKTLLQLESDRRREELAFWQDMAELRNSLLESKFEYRAMKDRFSLLGRLEHSGEGQYG